MEKQDYSQYPNLYALCFLADCKRKSECARFIAGQHVRPDSTIGYAVYPSALTSDGGCKHFRQFRVVKGAWGFDALFEDIKFKDMAKIRSTIKAYLGGNGTYSRYKLGERLLSPEQQEWIIALFKRYGYTENLHFDGYKDVIDWE